MYKTTAIDKAILKFYRKTSPLGLYISGLKQYAGKVWLPTKENEHKALAEIDRMLKKAKNDPVAKKFLRAERRGLLIEELCDPISAPSSYLYYHFLQEGFNRKHITQIAESCLKILDIKKYMLKKTWPGEIKILTVLECIGSLGVIATAKKNVKGKKVHQKLDALAAEIKKWKDFASVGKIKAGDFKEVFPLFKKYGKGIKRNKIYPKILKDQFDFPETAKDIEKKAMVWLDEELPKFKAITAKVASKLNCKNDATKVDELITKKYSVPRQKIIKTILDFRKTLQKITEKVWVEITPGYTVRVIETPKYMVPFIPSGAMNSFNSLTNKPYCVFWATNDPRGTPSTSVPDLIQLIIHEEYGHCVNFINSYKGYLGKLRLSEIIGSALDIPITEGLSFHREIESLDFFRHLEHKYQLSNEEKALMKIINKYADIETFNDIYEFVVRKWRITRFVRAITDSRVNTGKQRYASVVDWAAKKTGVPKRTIYGQTVNFLRSPGHASCYSMFGQRLAGLQRKAMEKGVSRVDFNTFVVSSGFPAQTILEKRIKKKFKL